MKIIVWAVALLSITTEIDAKELTLTTKDKFTLYADYFAPAKPDTKGVLMLHQCNGEHSMYQAIGKRLANKGVHALSLDFRAMVKVEQKMWT